MLTIGTFLWRPLPGYRSKFEGRHVDILRRMVRRHYPDPHRFVCVTDSPKGITEPDIEIYRLWQTFSNVRNPNGIKNPSCYRRLRVFARNAGDWLGERSVWLDLDCVITGDMRPIWNDPADFKIWRSATAGNTYNGSMFLLRSGARQQVWERFDPVLSPLETRKAKLFGSDQAWIAHCLGPHEKTWGRADGVFSYRIDIAPRGNRLPDNARIVFFHGRPDPFDADVLRRVAWVRENYR